VVLTGVDGRVKIAEALRRLAGQGLQEAMPRAAE